MSFSSLPYLCVDVPLFPCLPALVHCQPFIYFYLYLVCLCLHVSFILPTGFHPCMFYIFTVRCAGTRLLAVSPSLSLQTPPSKNRPRHPYALWSTIRKMTPFCWRKIFLRCPVYSYMLYPSTLAAGRSHQSGFHANPM